jgi:hypothetical protein
MVGRRNSKFMSLRAWTKCPHYYKHILTNTYKVALIAHKMSNSFAVRCLGDIFDFFPLFKRWTQKQYLSFSRSTTFYLFIIKSLDLFLYQHLILKKEISSTNALI